MYKRWFCLALAVCVAWASLCSAEELAIEDAAASVDAPGGELIIDDLPNALDIALTDDVELTLPRSGAEQGQADVNDGLAVTEALDDAAQVGSTLALSASELLIGVGEKYALLKATRSPEDGSDAVSWSSDDTSVVTVDSTTGKLTGVMEGAATVTASTASGLTASCAVAVKKSPDSVALNPARLTLPVGESYALKGELPSGTGSSLSYTSGKKAVATVDRQTGVVTAVAPGSTTIKVRTFNGHTASCKLTVVSTPVEVFLPETLTVFLKEKTTVPATAVDANGLEVSAKFTYSAEKGTGKISVNARTGLIKGTALGTAYLYVTTHNGVSTHLVDGVPTQTVCTVNVVKAPGSIVLDATEASIGVGELYPLNPRALAKDGTEIQGLAFTVSSSDESVASVGEDGVVQGLKPGSATVTVAAANGVQASCSVTVTDQPTDKVNYRLFAAYSYHDSLPFVKRNSESMVNVFSRSNIDGQRYQTKVLGNPSKTRILSGISRFFRDADDNDVSIVYFCSHGHNNKSSYTSYRLSLKGYDTDKNNTRYYLTSKEIFNSIQAIRGNVILILDSCYSGTFINDMKAKLSEEGGRIAVLTAASNTRASFYNNPDNAVDFFTFFLLHGLGYNEKEGWWTGNANGEEGSYPGIFSADKRGNGDGAATLGEFYSFAAGCIDVNIPNYMTKSWYWGETGKVQKTRIYAGKLKDLIIYRPE